MPRALLVTDAEGNAKVVMIPSPPRESVDGESESGCGEAPVGSARAQGVVEPAERPPVSPGDARVQHGSASGAELRAIDAVNAEDVCPPRASAAVDRAGASNADGGQHRAAASAATLESAAVDAGFVMVPRIGEVEEIDTEQLELEPVSMQQAYWIARGFSPLVAMALEECQVSPAHAEQGAPQDELAVLAAHGPSFGSKSAAVTSWVAAAYGQSRVARVASATHAAFDSGTACCAGGPREFGDARGRGRQRSSREGASQEARVVQGGGKTAQQVERDRVSEQVNLLLELIPEARMHKAFGFDEDEWQRVPNLRRSALVHAHLGTFSEGALRGSRLALARLRRWLVANYFPEAAEQFKCSGGLLAWWAQDEQATSRSKTGGLSVPNSLRDGCVFAARNLALPLEVDAPVFKSIGAAPSKPPVPALAATVAFLYHFAALGDSPVALVRLYSSGLVLCILAALRLRDAQRAAVEFRDEYLVGSCFSSKHPKRRKPVVMPFFSPLKFAGREFAEPLRSDCPKGPDYIFPALKIPRSANILHPAAARLDMPAKTSDVIKVMRFLLTQEPMRLTKAQAYRYSGHSLRHLMPTVARLFGFPKEDRDELARWAPTPEGRGQRRSMSNMYAQEAECGRVLSIVTKLLDKMTSRVQQLGGPSALPAQGGWQLFDTLESGLDLAGLAEAGAEPSSSEDDSDGD